MEKDFFYLVLNFMITEILQNIATVVMGYNNPRHAPQQQWYPRLNDQWQLV